MLWDQLHPSVHFRRGGDEQRERAMKQSVCKEALSKGVVNNGWLGAACNETFSVLS